MKIALLTPSRGRTEGLYRFFKSINDTISESNFIDLIIGIDRDDPQNGNYVELLTQMRNESKSNLNIVMIEDNRKPLCKLWNSLIRYSSADWFMCGNDDFVFDTDKWDEILNLKIKNLPHPYHLLFFDDGIQGSNHGAFPILSKEWIKEVGYYFPEIFIHNYPDTWVNEIAVKLGTRVFIPEIKGTHLHYSEGLSEYDQTYKDGMTDNSNEKDKLLFIQTEGERNKIVATLKKKIWNKC
jgi:hypothetical protein